MKLFDGCDIFLSALFCVSVIMPPIRRSNIGSRNRNTRRLANQRANETDEQRAQRNEQLRLRVANMRAAYSQEERADHMEADRVFRATRRANVDQHQRNLNERVARRNRGSAFNLNRAAFRYDSTIAYNDLPCVNIGPLNVVCQHCNVLKFTSETPGLCCAGGKVQLPVLAPPPEPLRSLLYDDTPQSRHFLAHTQQYNGCFQMTSFGATVVEERGFNPTFKVMSSDELSTMSNVDQLSTSHSNFPSTIQIQGQIHHRAGDLLPQLNEDHKFLQIYFLGNSNDELNQRCAIFRATKREIIEQLLHERNALVQVFKTALEAMPSDDYKIIIRPDKRPGGAHARQFNAPTIDEVAVVIVGENVESRDIVIKRRDTGHFQRVLETHRSYDALQYPLMFWEGDDGYHFQIKMVNQLTG